MDDNTLRYIRLKSRGIMLKRERELLTEAEKQYNFEVAEFNRRQLELEAAQTMQKRG